MKFSELMAAQLDILRAMDSGEIDLAEAQGKTRALQNVTKQAQLMVDHARLTSRLQHGSDVIPDATVEGLELPKKKAAAR